MLRLRLAIFAGRAAGALSRLLGRGGSALPGLIAERIDPRLIERLIATIPGGVTIVTGTNGKTTTTKMLVGALEHFGVRVLTNPTGSNLARGIATVLLTGSRRGRMVDVDMAVLEIDEAAVRSLAPRLSPRLVVATNLARDQLDRYGELDTTAGHVGVAVGIADRAVLNADDPAVAGLDAGRTAWFGATAELRDQVPHDRVLYGTDGPEEPAVDADALLVAASASDDGQQITVRIAGTDVAIQLRLPGVYNGYNAAAALLAAHELGVDPATASEALAAMQPAFGRGQTIEYRGRTVTVLLVKNPAGFNQALRVLRTAPATSVLIAINDLHADGRDVSWLWDVAFEELAETNHGVGATGIRAADMALRLKYAGVDAWSDADLDRALDRLVAESSEGDAVFVVPTYTAMLDLLDRLLPGTARAEAWS